MKIRSVAAISLATGAVLAFALLPGLAADTPANTPGFKIDPVHSSAIYRVKHVNVSYSWGRFNDISGTVGFNPAAPEATTFDVQIKTESVDTNNKGRDNHLKSPDFFNAKQFPVMTFKSKSTKKAGEGKLEVTGDFTLHGVTKEITVPVEITGVGKPPRGTGTLAGFETTFTIKRSDYNLSPKTPAEMLGEDIRIMVSLETQGQ